MLDSNYHFESNRRDFLKTATAASIGGAAIVSSMAGRAHAAGNDELKIALIGCGARGAGAAAQALSTGVKMRLWAVADAFPDRMERTLKALAAGTGGTYNLEKGKGFGSAVDVSPERQFLGLDAYRKAIDSGVDVVLIAAPPGFRPQHFEYAIQAGKHVFMEKPVATDAPGIRRVLASAELAKKKNLKVGVGLQRHHDPAYQEVVRRIQDGELGRIVSLRCYWNGGLPAKTAIARENMTELEYQVRNWYFFDWLSGDHICEQHVHNIDVCNWIMQSHPIRAEGMGGRQVRVGKEYGNIFDHHAVEFTYENGVKMLSYCRQMSGCKNLVAEFAEMTNGSAALGNGRFALTKDGESIWQQSRRKPTAAVSPYQIEHNVLFDAILNDKPHNEAENGALSTMTAILGRLATYSGQSIDWDAALQSDRKLTTDAETWDSPAPVTPKSDGSYAIAVPGISEVL
jgi:myo-inositol 2-dehydrogenase/D-chiro-inositol 1-dehydrogenase